MPGLLTIRGYQRSWLANDLVAGLVLTALLVPVGMGYAQAAGLPPITGLYATIVPLAVYAMFGPSRVMVLGPDSSLAAVIAAVILPLGGRDPETAVALAGALAVLTGLIILLAGIARLGFVTELLSRPVQLGYMSGIAVTILVGQLPRLCGFSVEGRGLAGIVVILVLRRVWRAFPGVMAAVVLGIVAVALFDLDAQGVKVIGVLPEGLPAFTLPTVELADLGALLSGALGIALVAVADTTVLSQSLAAQRDEVVDPNQELRALGAANLATGLFQGFAISSSASRTPVAVSAGARSQLTPLVGAVTIALLLLFAPGALRDLPLPMLAAIVITAAIGLIEVSAIRLLYRVRRSEFVLWLAAFGGVALLGVLWGIFVAILLSLADFVRRAWRPHDAVLGREDELKGYHDIDRHPTARRIPGLLLYRFDAPLFFANAGYFHRRVRRLVAEASHPVRWIVVAAEPITDIDTTAAGALSDLHAELRQQDITLAFAELKGPVKDLLKRYGLFDAVGPDRFFPTVGTAVNGYIAATGVDWVDWEERPAGEAALDPPRGP
jgi:MFS superfamily sulfate permease-like transporter